MRQKVELDPEQLTRRYYLRSQGIMGMKATYSVSLIRKARKT